MTDLRKAAQMALEALAWGEIEDAKEHLSQALAQRKTLAELLASTPVDEYQYEVVAEHTDTTKRIQNGGTYQQVPTKCKWVGFTDGERQYLRALGYVGIDDIEERLKRMNT